MYVIDNHPFVIKHVKTMIEGLCTSSNYDDTVVVLGYNVMNPNNIDDIRSKHPGCKLAVYNLEQLYDGSPWVNHDSLIWFRKSDEIWDYNLENINYLARNGISGVKYHPIKWVNSLKTLPEIKPDDMLYDVLFYGEETLRRYRILHGIMINDRKLKIVTATGVSGESLDYLISHSKIILNIHAFDDYMNQEIVRLFYPLINGRCVLTEKSRNDSYAGNSVVYCTLSNIGSRIKELLTDDKWLTVASEASERFRKHTNG